MREDAKWREHEGGGRVRNGGGHEGGCVMEGDMREGDEGGCVMEGA